MMPRPPRSTLFPSTTLFRAEEFTLSVTVSALSDSGTPLYLTGDVAVVVEPLPIEIAPESLSLPLTLAPLTRSEERPVGKKSRSRLSPYHLKKKKNDINLSGF